MTVTCRETRDAMARAVAPGELSAEHAAHAASCASCGAERARHEALASVTARARRAFEATPDLPGSSWVRIRAKVDAENERGARLVWMRRLTAGLAVAAAVALVAVGATVWTSSHEAEAVTAAARVDARSLTTDEAPPLAELRVAWAPPAASEDGEAVAVVAGTSLAADDGPRTISAFGRHTIALTAGTRVTVERWDAGKITLALTQGEVTCEVERADDEDVFEVRSGDAVVRVLGTVFSVALDEAGGTRVGVTRGKVSVTDGAGEERFVTAGGALTVPGRTTAEVEEDEAVEDPRPARRPVRRAPTRPRVKTIEVPAQKMNATGPAFDVSESLRVILRAMRQGRCDSALNALSAIDQGLGGGHGVARVYWMKAWCHRKLGDVAASDALFGRYRALAPSGAWPLPGEDGRLPPLPAGP